MLYRDASGFQLDCWLFGINVWYRDEWGTARIQLFVFRDVDWIVQVVIRPRSGVVE